MTCHCRGEGGWWHNRLIHWMFLTGQWVHFRACCFLAALAGQVTAWRLMLVALPWWSPGHWRAEISAEKNCFGQWAIFFLWCTKVGIAQLIAVLTWSLTVQPAIFWSSLVFWTLRSADGWLKGAIAVSEVHARRSRAEEPFMSVEEFDLRVGKRKSEPWES